MNRFLSVNQVCLLIYPLKIKFFCYALHDGGRRCLTNGFKEILPSPTMFWVHLENCLFFRAQLGA